MVWTAHYVAVQFMEWTDVKLVHNVGNNADGVVFRNVLVNSLRKKYDLFGRIETIVYLCHIINIYGLKVQKLLDIAKPWLGKVRAL